MPEHFKPAFVTVCVILICLLVGFFVKVREQKQQQETRDKNDLQPVCTQQEPEFSVYVSGGKLEVLKNSDVREYQQGKRLRSEIRSGIILETEKDSLTKIK